MSRAGRVLFATVLLAGCAGTAGRPAGPLQNAVALAATPDGRLWIVDAGSASVVVLRDGVVVQRLGGAGTGDDALIDPVGIDPTNGQAVFVADRAAGAIVHFTAEGRAVQSLAVPDVDPARPLRQPAASTGGRGVGVSRGQPVAVAAAPDGALYVADAGRRHVLRLDAEGTVERVLGAGGPGALSDPVALAVADDGTLWVADAGRGVLQSFDAYGAPGATVEVSGLGRLASLSLSRGRFVVTGATGWRVLGGDPPAASPTASASGAGVRAGVIAGDRVWLLRATGVGDARLD